MRSAFLFILGLNFLPDYLTNGSTIDSPYRTGQTNGNKGTLIVHSQQRVRIFFFIYLNKLKET